MAQRGPKGPRHEPIQGAANIEMRRVAGPAPAGADEGTEMWLLRCSLCGWCSTTSNKTAGLKHRFKKHPELQGHLYEPLSLEEVEARVAHRRERKRRNARASDARRKRAKNLELQEGGARQEIRADEDREENCPAPGELVRSGAPGKQPEGGDKSRVQEGGDEDIENRGGKGQEAAASNKLEGCISGVLSVANRGDGQVSVVAGRLSDESRQGIRVAITWAAAQTARYPGGLCGWLGRRTAHGRRCSSPGGKKGLRRLWLADERLSICFSDMARAKEGSSSIAAVVVSLVCHATGRRPCDDVAVSASLDLRGNLVDVTSLPAKLAGCKKEGMRLLVVPQSSIELYRRQGEEKALPSELKEYASNALRGVRNMVELLQLATYDCPPLPLDLAASGLPTPGVGVGHSIMYAERSNADGSPSPEPFVVEAALVEGGSMAPRLQEVHITGPNVEGMTPSVDAALLWLCTQADAIGEKLGLLKGWEARARSRDIHINFPNAWRNMDALQYTSVIAVALVCCLTGQRQRRDTAVVGDLMVHDVLLPKPTSVQNSGHVLRIQEQHFKRLVVGGTDAVSGGQELRRQLADARVELVCADRDDYSLVALLPDILEERGRGRGQQEEHEAEDSSSDD